MEFARFLIPRLIVESAACQFNRRGNRLLARLSSHHQAEYRSDGGIPACPDKRPVF